MDILQLRKDTTLTEAEKLELLRDPYSESPKYAWITATILCSIIAIFGLANMSYLFRRRYPALFANSWYTRKKTALWRYLAAKEQRVKAGRVFHFPVLGAGLVMLAFFLFMFTWLWSVKPYYYSHRYVHAPPLSIRAGFMALGCFPFIFAFATKVNVVTFVTGVSHEKLQVYHQYLSYLFLFFGWVHAIPFFIQGLSEYQPNTNPPMKQLTYQMLVAKKPYYWTGITMLVQLTILCGASLPYFRRKNYEFFKWLHVSNGIGFIGFFFVHCNRKLRSWNYLYATVVVYTGCVAVRFAYLIIRNGTVLPRAKYEVLDGGIVKLRIFVNSQESWRPGQHYFFNFPSCQPLQSHPFTIASMPIMGSTPHDRVEMQLLIQQASGLTAKLFKTLSACKSDTIPVLIDGPYGGLEGDLTIYEHVILFAGGTGITFAKPVLEDVLQRMDSGTSKTKTVELIWCVRTAENLEWLQDTFGNLQSTAPKGALKLTLHVTGAAGIPTDDEKKTVAIAGRPDIRTIIKQSAQQYRTLGVAACGPAQLIYDVRNAVAEEQRQILFGETNCKEVFLHTEQYSW